MHFVYVGYQNGATPDVIFVERLRLSQKYTNRNSLRYQM